MQTAIGLEVKYTTGIRVDVDGTHKDPSGGGLTFRGNQAGD